ncbi:MAG: TetR/AcrR family transcriptional regulator [Chloroflexi bacterium]|nr:TetR/AcrR family transcriptional regulator [Chloroflexota bacterium]
MSTKDDQPKSGRLSAAERRTAVIEAAVHEFASSGLAAGSTEAIAQRVGVSQPYLFKLFGTKKKLFLAAYEHVMQHVYAMLEAAAEANPEDPMGAMEKAYAQVLKRRDDQLLMLQAYAAAGDDEVRDHVRAHLRRVFAELIEMMGGDVAEARSWYAQGLLDTLGAVLDLPEFIE